MSSSLESFRIDPPLLNSSNPWATTYRDLLSLYTCPSTGAVTTRTSLWTGFAQDSSKHQYTFFSSSSPVSSTQAKIDTSDPRPDLRENERNSLNTLGYSPIPFEEYVNMITSMHDAGDLNHTSGREKPFIVSVTGTADEVARCYLHLSKTLSACPRLRLMMEINLSCPNIPDKPPPAYNASAMAEYICAIARAKQQVQSQRGSDLHVGIKTPPYTYHGQFQDLITALEAPLEEETDDGYPISFITATNTLGSCLVLSPSGSPACGNDTGIGGMAGDAIHPLSLGMVQTIRTMLDAHAHPALHRIAIIGIGGVSDATGFQRMRSAGAAAVGVGTALGREGIDVFTKISDGLAELEKR